MVDRFAASLVRGKRGGDGKGFFDAMMNPKRVLAIGAHPDDIEIGCLGYLLKLGEECEKHLFFASLGSAGDPSSGATRQAESQAACGCVRPATITFRQKCGILPTDHVELMTNMARLIAEHAPELVLVGSGHDTHQEHTYVYDALVSAMRRTYASALAYCGNSTTLDFHPTVFVDISDVVEAKIQALTHHTSQQGKGYLAREFFDVLHTHPYAAANGLRLCERFEPIRIFC